MSPIVGANSLNRVLNAFYEGGVVHSDVLLGGCLRVNDFSGSGFSAGSLVLEDGAFKTSSHSLVHEEEVGELSWDDFFDLLDRGNSLRSVASTTAVVDSHGVRGVVALLNGFGSFLLHLLCDILIIII